MSGSAQPSKIKSAQMNVSQFYFGFQQNADFFHVNPS
jgi:hypothetical protein